MSSRNHQSVFGVRTFTLPLACFDTLGLLINEKADMFGIYF